MGYLYGKYVELADKYPKALSNVYCGAETGAGWVSLVEPVLAECEATGTEVHQIKEKFGCLRIYVGKAPQSVYEAISKAECASAKVCETCGREASLTTDKRWMLTLCPSCMTTAGRK